MKYYELTIETTQEYEDILTDILISSGSEGVEVKNSAEIASYIESKFNFDYYEQDILTKQETVIVKAFFPNLTTLQEAQTEIDQAKTYSEFNTGSLTQTIREFADSEYKDIWKQYYTPIDFGAIEIIPEWLDKETTKPKLQLDPGCAFGTGSHHTTAMCINALNTIAVQGKTVIDIGCGSGILGLSAVILGAKSATLSDIDADALRNARLNAKLNNVTEKCTFAEGDLFDAYEITQGKEPKNQNTITQATKYDIVFANIVADVLIRLCPYLPEKTEKNGTIILSGILDKRLQEVVEACNKSNLTIIETKTQGDWAMIVAKVKEQ